MDAAARDEGDGPSAAMLRSMLSRDRPQNLVQDTFKSFPPLAKRLLVAECCSFLVGANPLAERWMPHVRWARQVGPDTVITFNYDLVLETLAKHVDPARERFRFVLPESDTVLEPGKTSVLKLHGSVNWQRTAGGILETRDDNFALHGPESELVIGSPGPSKLNSVGVLNRLWFLAKEELQAATTVIFIGYRFPQSDSWSRRELIEALGENGNPYLELHTVLGSNTSEPDTVRLKALLSEALVRRDRIPAASGIDPLNGPPNHYVLRVHPMWTEDFLDVYQPGRLGQEYQHWPAMT
jgi:hypothetical protein